MYHQRYLKHFIIVISQNSTKPNTDTFYRLSMENMTSVLNRSYYYFDKTS